MGNKEYWNKVHNKYKNNDIIYDNWLDEYKSLILFAQKPILDLGCGLGNDTLYLRNLGLETISLDYSEVALNSLKENIKDVKTIKADISKPLDFKDSSFDLVVADLSLHYFDDKTTISIMHEIKRILTNGGHLIARVNSTKDINYGSSSQVEIEPNYLKVNDINKRFFTLVDAIKYFSIIGDVKVKEAVMYRYSKPKFVYEILVEKI